MGFAAFELGAAANLRSYCALALQDFEAARIISRLPESTTIVSMLRSAAVTRWL